MSVPANNIGFVDRFVASDKFIQEGGKEEGNDISKLYAEGKEYTYLLTIAGKDPRLPVTIDPPFKNVVSVEVVQARIPFTEYTIESDRNTIEYRITRPGTPNYVDGSITLHTRDYTNDELIEEFNAKAKNMGDWLNLIRLGEEEGTGKFFFYTLRRNTGNANNMGGETEYNYTAAPLETPQFSIKATTTAYYPLGLSKTLGIADTASKPGSFRIVINGIDDTANTGTYLQTVACPFRYNLVVSDLVVLRCDELDSRLNREQTGAHVMPLAEFFLASPGMNESTFQKAIPDRPIAPPIPLSHLSLRFTRENTGSDLGSTMDYDFRGIRWFIKIAVKTLEFPSSEVLKKKPDTLENLTEGFKNTRNRKITYGPSGERSSMMSRDKEFQYIPAAYNSGSHGRI